MLRAGPLFGDHDSPELSGSYPRIASRAAAAESMGSELTGQAVQRGGDVRCLVGGGGAALAEHEAHDRQPRSYAGGDEADGGDRRPRLGVIDRRMNGWRALAVAAQCVRIPLV